MPIKVLLVEDNPADARLLEETLSEAMSGDFVLTREGRLGDALRRLTDQNHDLLLLDLSLPDSTGLATLRQARTASPAIPIVVLTGLDDRNVGVEALRAGAQDYLVKGQTDGRLLARTLGYALERKQAELERERLLGQLRSERALLETVLQQMPAGVTLAEAPSGKLILRNEQAARILGQSVPMFESIREYGRGRGFHADGRPYVPEDWPLARSLLRGEVVTDEEIRLLREDGTAGTILVNSAPIRDGAGKVTAAVATFHDITTRRRMEEELLRGREELEVRVRERTAELDQAVSELQQEVGQRIRAEQSLREQSGMLEAFFKHSLTPLALLDRHFNFIRVNEAYARADGRKVSDFPGHNHFEFYPDPDNQAIFEQVVRTKKPYQVAGRPFSYPDHPEWGVTYWDWALVPILDDAGEVETLVLSLEDVTQTVRAGQALRESEQRYRLLFDAAPIGIVLADQQGNVEAVNQGMCSLFRTGADQIRALGIEQLYLYPQQHREYLAVLQQQGRVRNWEAKQKRPDGSVFAALVNTDKVKLGEREVFFTTIRDITERKVLEGEILRAAEAERQRIGQDLHDVLGQNLTGVAFLIKGLQQQLPPKPAAEAARIAEMVNQVISHARALSRGLCPVETKAEGLMTSLADLAASTSNLYRLKCLYRCAQPVLVHDDAVANNLFHIAREAVNNAVKHARPKRITVSLSGADGTILLQVRDDGVGLPDGLDSRSGMGLNIMRYRAGIIGASLEVKRARGGGTVVSCWLRAQRGGEKAESQA